MMDSWYTEDAHGDPEITSREKEREYDCSIEFDSIYPFWVGFQFLRFFLSSMERDE